MKTLKILFYSYQHLNFNTGGLQNQIKSTKEALEQFGHKVIYLDEWLESKPKVDLCHQFSLHPSLISTFEHLLTLKVPIIISTVYNELAPPFKNRLAIVFNRIGLPLLYYRDIKSMRNRSSHLISLGVLESEILNNHFGQNSNVSILPNGVSNKIIEFDKSGIYKENYVVCVGSICKRKNQLNLIKVCNELNIKLKLIGPELKTEQHYVQQCKNEANDNIEFLGYMDNSSEIFIQTIAKAKVLALVSEREVLPISVFEALALGTNVCCTKNSAVSSYFTDEISYCNPHSIDDIKNKILYSYTKLFDNKVEIKVKEKYNWKTVARELENKYYCVLNESK